jgi:hypothetical protein
LLDGHLCFRNFLLDAAKLAVLEEYLDVELFRDRVANGLQAFRGILGKFRVSEWKLGSGWRGLRKLLTAKT